jgi:hypothetical protein
MKTANSIARETKTTIADNTVPRRRYYREGEVSQVTGVPLATLRRRRFLGQPPNFYRFGRSVLYDIDEVIDFIQRSTSGGAR